MENWKDQLKALSGDPANSFVPVVTLANAETFIESLLTQQEARLKRELREKIKALGCDELNTYGQGYSMALIDVDVLLSGHIDVVGVSKLEKLADLEHEQWIAWSKDIADTETINETRRQRWSELWVPYSQLTEAQKDQDREWACKVLLLLQD